MNTLPDFFGGVSNLSNEQRIQWFDDLIALYYMIGYRHSNAILNIVPSEELCISITGLSDEEAEMVQSEVPLRILCKNTIKSLNLIKQEDGSIIATII